MADAVEKAAVKAAIVARMMLCQKYYRAAVEEGCKQRHTRKKCPPTTPVAKDLFTKASRALCGYKVTRGYDWGCDPNFKSNPLFGKPLCARWTKKKGGRRTRKRKTQRKTQRRRR